MTTISHPIPINSTVEVLKPICPCNGGGVEVVIGKVLKVIENQAGFWYYLTLGITVKADRVQQVLLVGVPEQ